MHNCKYITFLLTKLSRSPLQRIQYKLFCLAFMTFVWIFHNICPNLQAKWFPNKIKGFLPLPFCLCSLHLECPLSTALFPSLSIKTPPSFKTLHNMPQLFKRLFYSCLHHIAASLLWISKIFVNTSYRTMITCEYILWLFVYLLDLHFRKEAKFFSIFNIFYSSFTKHGTVFCTL